MSEMTSRSAHGATYLRGEETREVTGWVGWIGFAGLLMILQGIFQSISGLVGIFKSTFYLVGDNASQLLIFSNVHFWGWVNLIVGIVVFFAGLSLFTGSTWSRVVAILVAMGAAVANLVSISLYPIWSIIGITLSVLIMYAVIVHGREMKAL